MPPDDGHGALGNVEVPGQKPDDAPVGLTFNGRSGHLDAEFPRTQPLHAGLAGPGPDFHLDEKALRGFVHAGSLSPGDQKYLVVGAIRW